MATQDLGHRECLVLLRLGEVESYLLETLCGWRDDLPPEATARGGLFRREEKLDMLKGWVPAAHPEPLGNIWLELLDGCNVAGYLNKERAAIPFTSTLARFPETSSTVFQYSCLDTTAKLEQTVLFVRRRGEERRGEERRGEREEEERRGEERRGEERRGEERRGEERERRGEEREERRGEERRGEERRGEERERRGEERREEDFNQK
ncbi:hypothetical protein DUI87_16804 [Hirundo rustica rustica]|uniref:Uncharacterized protein n=1 Tax=Hirundo rustica rustica TaxID=333673 RepID=A0A3M0K7P0_HIRRU|nr:hypothetical protein DUI87_16804 [Hirundo rustica rustica]